MWYKVIGTGISFQNNDRFATVNLEKTTFPFFWRSKPKMRHKVFFDLYDLKATHKIYDGFATIDQDWIDLWYKDRNKVKSLITKHFQSDYTVGNFRNTIKKL